MFSKWLIYLGVVSFLAGVACYLASYRFLKEDHSHFEAFMRGSFQETSHYTETGRRLVIANRLLAVIALALFILGFFVVGPREYSRLRRRVDVARLQPKLALGRPSEKERRWRERNRTLLQEWSPTRRWQLLVHDGPSRQHQRGERCAGTVVARSTTILTDVLALTQG